MGQGLVESAHSQPNSWELGTRLIIYNGINGEHGNCRN
jgi:hypothetical protein